MIRFRLWSLLALTAVVAIILAGYKAYVAPFQIQRRAARQLEAVGASVEFRTADTPWAVALFGRQNFQHVVAVDLERCNFAADDLAPLVDLRRLERLYLANSPVTDPSLRYVRRLGQLKRLSLWKTQITDKGIEHLAGLSNLEVLDIHDTKLTEAALKHFHGHPRMTRLIHSIPVTDLGVGHLASMPKLRVDSLDCVGVTDRGMRLTANLDWLEWIRVDSPHVTDAGLKMLNRLKHLRGIEIRNCPVTDVGVEQLAKAPAMKVLRIEHAPLGGECLRTLSRLAGLEQLALVDTDVQFGQIAKCFGPTATWLSISGERVYQKSGVGELRFTGRMDSEDVVHLSRYSNLETLTFEQPPFDVTRATFLERLEPLRSLELNFTCDDTAAEWIGRLTQLRQLGLAGRQSISSRGFLQLGRLKQLKGLRMRSCGLTDDDLAFLSELKELEVLEIPGNPITRVGIEHLGSRSKLRRLNVSFCPEIDDRALAAISRLPHLEDLSAQDTLVTDKGLTYLYDLPNLRDVTVLGSDATPKGLRSLRGALLTKGGTIY